MIFCPYAQTRFVPIEHRNFESKLGGLGYLSTLETKSINIVSTFRSDKKAEPRNFNFEEQVSIYSVKLNYFSLRDIAEYIDSITHKSAMVKAFGSGTGIVAGSLTLAGGILVFY